MGLAASASLFVAPDADAQFKEQYDTNFDNRFYEFDPLRERVTGPAGRGQAPLVLSRDDVVDLIRNDPATVLFPDRDTGVSGLQLTPFRSPPLVLEEDEVVTTPAGNLRAADGSPGRVFFDAPNDRFVQVQPINPASQGRPLPNNLITPEPPFDASFLAAEGTLQGVASRSGQEVRFSGRDLNTDPVTLPIAARNTLIAAQTQTNLVADAERYRFSTELRIDRMERRSPNTIGGDTGFFINVDLGNAGSGDFTVEFANEFRGRTNPDGTRYSIFFSNSESGTRRRVGSYTPGDQPLSLAMQITAATGRLRLSLNGETLKQANIDLDTSSSYTPTVTMFLRDTINVFRTNANGQLFTRSAYSSVSLESLQSYYNPEPGTVMVGMASLGLLLRRRR
ncbi:MAG: hypothetical protein AAF328_08855 [Planctomycetota bacterium]